VLGAQVPWLAPPHGVVAQAVGVGLAQFRSGGDPKPGLQLQR